MKDLLTAIQRHNKFQTRKRRRETVHAQLQAANELVEHVHFGEDGEVESVETITTLEALVLERRTLEAFPPSLQHAPKTTDL